MHPRSQVTQLLKGRSTQPRNARRYRDTALPCDVHPGTARGLPGKSGKCGAVGETAARRDSVRVFRQFAGLGV